MKKYLVSLFVFLCICTTALSAEDWTKFEDNVYIARGAIKKISPESYFIKIKILNTKTDSVSDIAYTIIEETIDCKNNKLIPESVALYSSDGKLLGKRNKNEISQKSQEIKPEFIEAKMKPKICSGKWVNKP